MRLLWAEPIMASKLKHDEGPPHPPTEGFKGLRRKLKAPIDYPPFTALQLVFRDYLQESPSSWFKEYRLVSKQFKSAVEAAHPPYTWHFDGGRLKNELQTVMQFIVSEPRWEWVTKVRLTGGGVSMTQGDCELLVAALGARAWKSISLVEVRKACNVSRVPLFQNLQSNKKGFTRSLGQVRSFSSDKLDVCFSGSSHTTCSMKRVV